MKRIVGWIAVVVALPIGLYGYFLGRDSFQALCLLASMIMFGTGRLLLIAQSVEDSEDKVNAKDQID